MSKSFDSSGAQNTGAERAYRMAIILAAGRGSRMGPVAASQPKCLAHLGGRPLLEWQLSSLAAAGFSRVTVVAGYRAEMLEGPFERIINERWAETSSVGSLCAADTVLSSVPCVVSYADIVYHPAHVVALETSPYDIAITYDELWASLWTERFAQPLSDAETFEQRDGRLITIGARPKSMSEVQGQFMGLIRFTPRGWGKVRAYLESISPQEADRLDFTSMFAALLARGVEIGAVPVRGRWCEADNAEDLELYRRHLAAVDAGDASWSHDWRVHD